MPQEAWRALFEDRYGPGALERLIDEIRQPCLTFAEIARHFGVSRERVRQWQMLLLPDAPRGHDRQRLCKRYQQKRRLLEDPLFASFYRNARRNLEAEGIGLIGARDGYRSRSIRLHGRIIALRNARAVAPPGRARGAPAYMLPGHRGTADFIYYRLTAEEYLLVPKHEVTAGKAVFLDQPASAFYAFKNSFEALRAGESNPAE